MMNGEVTFKLSTSVFLRFRTLYRACGWCWSTSGGRWSALGEFWLATSARCPSTQGVLAPLLLAQTGRTWKFSMTTVRWWVLVTNSPFLSNAISWSELSQGSLSYNLEQFVRKKVKNCLRLKKSHLGLLSAEAAGVLSRLLLSARPAVGSHERKQKFLLGPRHGCSGVAHVSWHAQLPHVQVTPHILAFNCYSETKGKYQYFGIYSLLLFDSSQCEDIGRSVQCILNN